MGGLLQPPPAELVELDDDLAAAWSKLEAYTARFALIFQLLSWAAGEADGEAVDQTSMESAITLSDWFGGEARRVYGLFAEREEIGTNASWSNSSGARVAW